MSVLYRVQIICISFLIGLEGCFYFYSIGDYFSNKMVCYGWDLIIPLLLVAALLFFNIIYFIKLIKLPIHIRKCFKDYIVFIIINWINIIFCIGLIIIFHYCLKGYDSLNGNPHYMSTFAALCFSFITGVVLLPVIILGIIFTFRVTKKIDNISVYFNYYNNYCSYYFDDQGNPINYKNQNNYNNF